MAFFEKWLNSIVNIHQTLYQKLLLMLGLFFVLPGIGLIYFGIKYNISRDTFFVPFLLALLISLLLGFRLLRKTYENIKKISDSLSRKADSIPDSGLTAVTDEIGRIVYSFRVLEEELNEKVSSLEKKTEELEALKDLSNLSYMTLNADYLLSIALEKALKLVDADIGSVMMLSDPDKENFVIKASIGHGDHAKKGTVTPFDDSVVKYTVINKAPLLVDDIENDTRFGRQSRGKYSTKSFICMPMKTSHEIIGAMTISRRRSDRVFTKADVDVLSPLLSNAAYIYDNINLFQEATVLKRNITLLRIITKALNTSLKKHELLQVIFEQMRRHFAFDVVALLGIVPESPDKLYIVDFKSFIPTNLTRGRRLTHEDSVMQKAIKEQRPVFIRDVTKLSAYMDKKLFHHQDVKTALVMPLKTEGRITGVILLMNILEKDWNTIGHLLDAIGDYLSLAIEKDWMSDLLIKRDRELNIMRYIGDALTASTFEIEKILDHAMEMIKATLPVEAAHLMLPDQDELYFAAAFRLDMNKIKNLKIRRDEGIAGHVFEHGVPVIVNDAKHHPQYSPAFDHETGFTTRTILCVPLISRSRVTGVITLLNKTEGIFDETDEKLMQSIASTVGIALENARLYYTKGY
ncbi:MAG: GAF domain-containing protein [Deltaproteobacteria bacterium]|nr:GAF domain-containing protein [Deltaproteobacteria bacterium]